jgi:hypothetical protein
MVKIKENEGKVGEINICGGLGRVGLVELLFKWKSRKFKRFSLS